MNRRVILGLGMCTENRIHPVFLKWQMMDAPSCKFLWRNDLISRARRSGMMCKSTDCNDRVAEKTRDY